MLVRAFAVAVVLLVATPTTPPDLSASNRSIPDSEQTELVGQGPDDTINEFLPEDRGLGECISAVPKPGCGSEARGGWRQGLVLALILAGLGVIAWRVVVAARRARPDPRVDGDVPSGP